VLPPLQTQHSETRVRQSYAGYTNHPPVEIRTRYYGVRVGVWCDELPLSSPVLRGRRKGEAKSKDVSEERAGEVGKEAVTTLEGDNEGVARSKDEPDNTAIEGAEEQEEQGDMGEGDEEVTAQSWLNQMLSAPAREVRDAIGAIILTLPVELAVERANAQLPVSKNALGEHGSPDADGLDGGARDGSGYTLRDDYLQVLRAVHTLREAIEDERGGGNVSAIIILQGTLPKSISSTARISDPRSKQDDNLVEAIEDQLLSAEGIMGWDVVSWAGKVTTPSPANQDEELAEVDGRRNAYGELTGLSRVREVLEGVDWTPHPHSSSQKRNHNPPTSINLDTLDISCDSDADPEDVEVDLTSYLNQSHSKARDSEGLGDLIGEEDEEIQVEQLQGLLQQAMAIKEAGAEMPRARREEYARRMVGELMGDL
jgi:Alpha and gamma adaptin binding protein p34